MDVKAKLSGCDRAKLLNLVRDLYAAHRDNQSFLHARFSLGKDALAPYKRTIERWLWPDILRNRQVSAAKAKKAISDYKKSVDDPAKLAELMTFYCECAAGFSSDIGYADESFLGALVRMFEQAIAAARMLPDGDQNELIARLNRVLSICHAFG